MVFKINLDEPKNYKIRVQINGEFFGWFKQKTISGLKIKNNMELSEKEFTNLQKILEEEYCKPKALQILALRDHSKQELAEKLKKIANSKTVEKVILNLQDVELIDDLKYAENLTKNLILKKFHSKQRVLYELKSKGLAPEIVTAALEKINIDPVEQLVLLIEKKYINKINSFESKQKVIRALLQRGHNYSDVLAALSKMVEKP